MLYYSLLGIKLFSVFYTQLYPSKLFFICTHDFRMMMAEKTPKHVADK